MSAEERAGEEFTIIAKDGKIMVWPEEGRIMLQVGDTSPARLDPYGARQLIRALAEVIKEVENQSRALRAEAAHHALTGE